MPVIPTTWKAEAGELQVQKQLSPNTCSLPETRTYTVRMYGLNVFPQKALGPHDNYDLCQ